MSAGGAVLLLAVLAGVPDDEAGLRASVEQFFAAVARKDPAAALALWSADAPQREQVGKLAETASPVRGLKTDDFAVEGDTASATVRFTGKFMPVDGIFDDEEQTLWRVEFRRDQGRWLWTKQSPAALALFNALYVTEEKEARLALLKGNPDLVKMRLIRILCDAAEELATTGEPAEAEKLTALATEAADFSGRKKLQSPAYLIAGILSATMKKPGEAVPILRKARGFADDLQDAEAASKSRSWLGFALSDANRPDEGLEELKKALEIAEKAKQTETIILAEKITGMVQVRRGDLKAALRSHERAAALSKGPEYLDEHLQALCELATVHWQMGNFGAALQAAMEGLKLAEAPDQVPNRAKLLNSMGLVYLSSGEHAKALEALEEALKLWTTLQLPRVIGALLSNIGETLRLMGRYPEAIARFQEAFKILEETQDRAVLIAARNNLALIHRTRGDLDLALEQYRLCVQDSERTRSPAFLVAALCNTADILTAKKDWDGAFKELERAAALAKESGSAPYRFMVALSTAMTSKRRGGPLDLARAADSLKQAAVELEHSRGGLRDPALQQSYLAQHAPLYSMLADTQLRLRRFNDAFAASEEGKARTLLDLFGAGDGRIVKSMTPEERREEARLENDLRILDQRLDAAVLSDERQALEAGIEKARTGLEDFRRGVFVRHPELESLRGRFAPASIEELHRKLLTGTPRTALLSYLLGQSDVLLFALVPGAEKPTLRVHRIEIDLEKLQEKVDAFWAQCSRPGSSYEASARDLYALLIRPAEKLLAESDVERVVVIPDGLLHGLPFQALQDAAGLHLIEKWSVSFAPSATALLRMEETAALRRAEAPKGLAPLLAAGAPEMPPGFSDLDHAKREIEILASKYGVPPLTGKAATETRLKTEMEKARRIHISTHGKVNEASPLYSFVVLGRDESNDGLLHAREIMDLHLRADLVVLSACETALGKQVRGEGVVGLTWALFAAGAPATLLSQWQVADESTGILMASFHAAIEAGTPFGTALRRAQRDLLRDPRRAHPYYWAPFVLVGTGRG